MAQTALEYGRPPENGETRKTHGAGRHRIRATCWDRRDEKTVGSYRVEQNDNDRRFDRVIRKMFPDLELGSIYRLIRKGGIRLNGKKTAPSHRVRHGDRIAVPPDIALRRPSDVAAGVPADRVEERVAPTALSFSGRILAEDKHILAVDKPSGIVVHGRDSLDSLVQRYLAPRIAPSLSFRPGPGHRLDRNTTGIVLFAKSLHGARHLSRLLREGRVEKRYIGLLDGTIRGPLVWQDRLRRNRELRKTALAPGSGQTAHTSVMPIATESNYTLVLFTIGTGRTHQIRAQASLHGHALTGDRKYEGSSSLTATYLLHAASIRLPQRESTFSFDFLTAPLPPPFSSAIAALFGMHILETVRKVVRAPAGAPAH